MCTVTNNAAKKVAEEDIKCIKMLQIMADVSGNPVYVTPYQYKHVPEEILKGEKPLEPKLGPEEVNQLRFSERLRIEGGFIHVYSDKAYMEGFLSDIEYLCSELGQYDHYFYNWLCDHAVDGLPEMERDAEVLGIAIYSAIIPKGTEYIEGYDEASDTPLYAAKRIVLTKQLAVFNTDNYCRSADDLDDLLLKPFEKDITFINR